MNEGKKKRDFIVKHGSDWREPEGTQKLLIIDGLMKKLKPGGGVWMNGRLPRIRKYIFEEPWPISWREAAEIAGVPWSADTCDLHGHHEAADLIRERYGIAK